MKKKIAIEIQISGDDRYCGDCKFRSHFFPPYCDLFYRIEYDGDNFHRHPKCKGAEKRMQNALNKAYERGHTL